MLILLFILALIRHLNGVPTIIPPPLGSDPPDLYLREIPLHNHLTTRSVSNIIVSCLATIFACTWTAIHPNIPSPCDSSWEVFKRKVTTTIYAILAPEMITAWALRQHLAAGRIAKVYNNEVIDKRSWIVRSIEAAKAWFCGEPLQDMIRWLYREPLEGVKKWFRRHPAPPVAKEGEVVKWTITHGFFIQMGGFMLCEGGKQLKPLNQLDDLKARVRRKEIDAPRITEGEIKDRSKGDGLTKAIVVLQTTWFIAQCIVRWSSSLPVTELEVLTLGFAMLNGITYALWWHKPQSVRLPVYLEKKGTAGRTTGERREVMDRKQGRAQDKDSGTLMKVAPEKVEVMTGGDETRGQGADECKSQVAGRAWTAADPAKEEAPPAKRTKLSRELIRGGLSTGQKIWRIPFALVLLGFHPLIKIIDPSAADAEEGQLRVPMFHSGHADTATLAIASSAIGSIFGLIHFIPAFFLVFSSRAEMFLWRISAGIITVHPIVLAVSAFYIDSHRGNLAFLMAILLTLGSVVYVIARLALFTLAFLSLHTIHGNTLAMVDWISFIPHL